MPGEETNEQRVNRTSQFMRNTDAFNQELAAARKQDAARNLRGRFGGASSGLRPKTGQEVDPTLEDTAPANPVSEAPSMIPEMPVNNPLIKGVKPAEKPADVPEVPTRSIRDAFRDPAKTS